jgi:hypothetical protein
MVWLIAIMHIIGMIQIDFGHDYKCIRSINVWCGILNNKLIGPYFYDGTLTGERYLDFLENILPLLLEDIHLYIQGYNKMVHRHIMQMLLRII